MLPDAFREVSQNSFGGLFFGGRDVAKCWEHPKGTLPKGTGRQVKSQSHSGNSSENSIRGHNFNAIVLLLKLFRHPGISQHKSWDRQKVWFPWVSSDMPNFLAPTPFTGKSPTPPEDIWTQSFSLCSFLLPDKL